MATDILQKDQIFNIAAEIHDLAARSVFLDDACRGSDSLRKEIEELLAHDQQASRFLTPPVLPVAIDDQLPENEPVAERPGTVIGPYKLLEQIGEGGFGVVYSAEQERPVRRRVALKIIKPGMDTRQVIARFEAERQALALMDHSNIAKVHDAGATKNGRPYFVMELVQGVPITEYCDQCNLATHERLELFVTVCQAVQHAHQKGVIHRDIKPTNILVAMQDGLPAPKIIDFGVAKALNQRLTEHTLATGYAQMIGTPLYMSPEQAELSPLGADTRSDIYSLGVLLYELLTGATPFDKDRLHSVSYDELRRIIREEEPLWPSVRISTLAADLATTVAERRRVEVRRLLQTVRGELDWIVMKCLEKDRNRRYESAGALAMDIRHYLAYEPVEASPPSVTYRFRTFMRRNKATLLTMGLVMAALVFGIVVSSWQAIRASIAENLADSRLQAATNALHAESVARDEAEQAMRLAKEQENLARQQRDLTLWNLYTAQIRLAHQDWKVGNLNRMAKTLNDHRPSEGRPDLRGWEWYYLASLLRQHKDQFDAKLGAITDVRWSPDGRLVAIVGILGVKVYEPISQAVAAFFPNHALIAWSPDGTQLATVKIEENKHIITVLSTDDWHKAHELTSPVHVSTIVWRADGRALAWGSGMSQFMIWVKDEDTTSSFHCPVPQPLFIGAMDWSPDRRLIAMGGAFPSTLITWNVAEQKLAMRFDSGGRGITHISWHPKGDKFATASIAGDLDVWSAESGKLIFKVGTHNGHISSCRWSSDGKYLVSAGVDNLVRVWDAQMGRQLNTLHGHRAVIQAADLLPKGDLIVSGGQDGLVNFWQAFESQDELQLPGRHTVAWSPNGSRIVSNDPRGEDAVTYTVRDSRSGQAIVSLESATASMYVFAWSPDGKTIAGAGVHGSAHLWNSDNGRLILSLPRAHTRENIPNYRHETRCVAWSPDNSLFATCGTDRLVKIWDTSSGMCVRRLAPSEEVVGSVRWSPDGRWLASADWARDIKVWATDTWQLQWEIDQERPTFGPSVGGDYTIAWSPDSRQLATVSGIGDLVVWRLLEQQAARKLWSCHAHTSNIRSIAWSPDGRRIASGSEDRSVKTWDAHSGHELLRFDGHSESVKSVGWSPDGRRLASVDSSSTVRIWDATPAYQSEPSLLDNAQPQSQNGPNASKLKQSMTNSKQIDRSISTRPVSQ